MGSYGGEFAGAVGVRESGSHILNVLDYWMEFQSAGIA